MLQCQIIADVTVTAIRGAIAIVNTGLTSALGLKAPLASPSFTGSVVSAGDVSLNAGLRVASDVSFNRGLFVRGNLTVGTSTTTPYIGIGMDASSSYAVSVKGAVNAVQGVLNDGNLIDGPLASLSTVLYENYCANFNILNSATNYDCVAMSSDGKYISAAGWVSGNVYVSTNYGATWTARNTGVAQIDYIFMSADGKYQYIGGLASGRSADYGTTWGTAGGSSWSFGVSSTGQYVLVGANADLRVSTDYGVSWRGVYLTSGLPAGNYRNCAVSASGQFQATSIANTTSLYVSKDFGLTWKLTTMPNASNSIAMSGTGQYILCITTNAVSLSSDYGATFASVSVTGSTFYKGRISTNGQYQLVTNSVGISYSTDYGVTWATKSIGGGTIYPANVFPAMSPNGRTN